jgi:hypothetical protein
MNRPPSKSSQRLNDLEQLESLEDQENSDDGRTLVRDGLFSAGHEAPLTQRETGEEMTRVHELPELDTKPPPTKVVAAHQSNPPPTKVVSEHAAQPAFPKATLALRSPNATVVMTSPLRAMPENAAPKGEILFNAAERPPSAPPFNGQRTLALGSRVGSPSARPQLDAAEHFTLSFNASDLEVLSSRALPQSPVQSDREAPTMEVRAVGRRSPIIGLAFGLFAVATFLGLTYYYVVNREANLEKQRRLSPSPTTSLPSSLSNSRTNGSSVPQPR